jgi:hypothetical protein
MNKGLWIVIGLVVVVIALITVTSLVVYYYLQIKPNPSPPLSVIRHIFKAKEIYPTKPGGREWFINMASPTSDKIFDPQSAITRQPDGSWQIEGRQTNSKFGNEVRMNVNTPKGQEPWKNVEMTGYAKVISAADSPSNDHLDWYARGGKHTDNAPCDGSALKGWLSVDGIASWVKEIWFPGGYTDQRDKVQATTTGNSILGRWIGWKVVMYNIDNDKAVKMESYLDDQDNNHWKKVTDLVDNGEWYARGSDEEFYSAGCGRAKDYIITNAGPIATFRSDKMLWDFSDLSVREIHPTLLAK